MNRQSRTGCPPTRCGPETASPGKAASAIWLINYEQAPAKARERYDKAHLVGRPISAGLLLSVTRLPVAVIGVAILGYLIAGTEFTIESLLREVGLLAPGR